MQVQNNNNLKPSEAIDCSSCYHFGFLKTTKMKAGSSKQKINKKLTKKADAILDWDNKKANPSIVKRIIKATDEENEFFNRSNQAE